MAAGKSNNRRAKKREREARDEATEAFAKGVETGRITKKTDEDLFVLDRTPDKTIVQEQEVLRRRYLNDEKKKKKRKGLSELDKTKVNALVERHSRAELERMAEAGKNEVENAKRRKRVVGNYSPGFDLWGTTSAAAAAVASTRTCCVSEERKKNMQVPKPGIGMSMAGTAPAPTITKAQRAVSKAPTPKSVAVQVAHSGQSYHPDPEKHQDVIGEALALELKRNEATTYAETPISKGLTEETRALLLGSDDEESEDEEDDQEDVEILPITRRREKLTRAQRNKQKRHRQQLKEIDERKKRKKLENKLSEMKRINKDLKKLEETQKERRDHVRTLKEQAKRTLGKDVLQHLSERDPTEVPTLPVALSTELSGSLRTAKVKGSLLEDRFESFRDRKMADPKQVGDKKKVVQGKRRFAGGKARKKVKGRSQYVVQDKDGSEFVLMG